LLETPSIRRYSFIDTPTRDDVSMGSDNPSGAVNQQERPDAEQWAVGFIDGGLELKCERGGFRNAGTRERRAG
jgi:hypothetical protein